MKINLINFKNKIYKNQEKAQNPIKKTSKESDFSLAQNIMSNYSKAMISFNGSIFDEDLEEYIKAHPKETQTEIAEHFGVSVATISRIIRNKKIDYPRKSKKIPSEKKLKKYIAQNPNANQSEIAEHFKISKSTVSKKIAEYEIDYVPKREKLNDIEEEFREYIKTNPDATIAKIAEHFEISTSTASRLITRFGIEYHKKETQPIQKAELQEYISLHPEANQTEIAEYFNTSEKNISQLIRSYGIKYKKKFAPKFSAIVTKEELKRYIKTHPTETLEQIGENFGVTRQAIYNIIQRHNIEYNRKNILNSVTKERLESYVAQNPTASIEQIAKHFKVLKSSIVKLIRQYDIQIGNSNEN